MKQLSTRSLGSLPSVNELVRLSKAVAMLDAVLSPDWEYRYYSFNSKWGAGEMMASMRDGSGNEYFILFDKHGAAIKGFDHESPMSPWVSSPPKVWPGIYDHLPAEFSAFLNEPAFSISDVTFCIWRRPEDPAWQCGAIDFPAANDPDGSEWMLAILDGNARTYQEFAREYYEVDIPLSAIEHVYQHSPLTDEVIGQLNGDLTLAKVEADALEIGYPHSPV